MANPIIALRTKQFTQLENKNENWDETNHITWELNKDCSFPNLRFSDTWKKNRK